LSSDGQFGMALNLSSLHSSKPNLQFQLAKSFSVFSLLSSPSLMVQRQEFHLSYISPGGCGATLGIRKNPITLSHSPVVSGFWKQRIGSGIGDTGSELKSGVEMALDMKKGKPQTIQSQIEFQNKDYDFESTFKISICGNETEFCPSKREGDSSSSSDGGGSCCGTGMSTGKTIGDGDGGDGDGAATGDGAAGGDSKNDSKNDIGSGCCMTPSGSNQWRSPALSMSLVKRLKGSDVVLGLMVDRFPNSTFLATFGAKYQTSRSTCIAKVNSDGIFSFLGRRNKIGESKEWLKSTSISLAVDYKPNSIFKYGMGVNYEF